MIAHGSVTWQYLTAQQRVLADDGAFLVADCENHKDQEPTDFSYLVFCFAKLYEGFLKDLLLDLDIINRTEYGSNHFRIGRVLNPNLARRLREKSAYSQLASRFGEHTANQAWQAWKNGRNLVFHYFPKDYRLLRKDQAIATIGQLVEAMEALSKQSGVRRGVSS